MSTPSLPKSATLSRIASLDGLRAVSILLVVSLHSLQRLNAAHPISLVWFGIFNGGAGVFIFFEISGFLITSLLLREDEKRGSVSLRGFYLRRAFRILPPLYLYLAVMCLLGWAGKLPIYAIDIVGSAFFFHNIVAAVTWPTEHLWSISVEEQFYLVWPFILVFCLRWKGLQGRLRAAIFPAAVILISPVARVLLALSHNAELHKAGVFYLRFDFIMFGCLVALLQHTPRFEAVYRVATRLWWAPLAVMIACNLLSTRFENYFDLTIGFTINGFAIAMFLLWSTRNAGSAMGRLLNSWPMAKIGVLSYSIYLWQTLFLHDQNEAVFSFAPWLGQLPFSWLGFALAGTISYYVVEQPTLKLRDWAIARWRIYRAGRVTALKAPASS